MKGQNIGYIRVSTLEQNTQRQLHDQKLDKVFIDKASGQNMERPQLHAMLEFIREGDQLFVHSMDRLGRNLVDLRNLVQQLTQKGVQVRFAKEGLTFTGEDSSMAILMLSILGAFAECERSIIRERQREGIALAKVRGVYRGRKRAMPLERLRELHEAAVSGKSKSQLAREFHISRGTVYRYLEEKAAQEKRAETSVPKGE